MIISVWYNPHNDKFYMKKGFYRVSEVNSLNGRQHILINLLYTYRNAIVSYNNPKTQKLSLKKSRPRKSIKYRIYLKLRSKYECPQPKVDKRHLYLRYRNM